MNATKGFDRAHIATLAGPREAGVSPAPKFDPALPIITQC